MFLAVGPRIGLQAENPLVAEAHHIARAAKIQLGIARSNDAWLRPVRQIGAFAPRRVEIGLSVSFELDQCKIKMKHSILINRCWITVSGARVALEKDWSCQRAEV